METCLLSISNANQGVRTFVSVDGGMADNVRPPLYSAKYTVLSVTHARNEPTELVTVVGKYCESGDFVARDVWLPPVATDDILAVPVSGAYHISMASNYNCTLRPAVLFAVDGKARVVQRRETYDDLLARCSI